MSAGGFDPGITWVTFTFLHTTKVFLKPNSLNAIWLVQHQEHVPALHMQAALDAAWGWTAEAPVSALKTASSAGSLLSLTASDVSTKLQQLYLPYLHTALLLDCQACVDVV